MTVPAGSRPRLLFVHRGLRPPGGGEGVAACLLDALARTRRYDITIASLRASDFDGLNRCFGTALEKDDFEFVFAPPWIDRLVAAVPTPAGLLEMSLLERFVRQLARRRRVDLFLSTCNEQGFPQAGIQYIHYPKYHPVRGVGDYRWYHRIPGLLALYRRACRSLVDLEAVSRNRTLANSRFTARAYREIHAGEVHVVHPPVPGAPPPLEAWEHRANRFLCIGRLAPEKNLPGVIEIVRRARERLPAALAPQLLLVGNWDCSRFLRAEIESLLARHADWLSLALDPSREELGRLLASSRYGIHGMTDEHFGMGVAEMQRAGCIAFVPATGGPPEIIGEDEPRQLYRTCDEAVEHILRVLADPASQRTLHRRALERASLFSTERFVSECLEHIEAALGVGVTSRAS